MSPPPTCPVDAPTLDETCRVSGGGSLWEFAWEELGSRDPHRLALMAVTLRQRGPDHKCREMVLVLDLCYGVETVRQQGASVQVGLSLKP